MVDKTTSILHYQILPLFLFQDLLGDLLKIYHDNISSAENDIENILTEVNQKKKLNYNAWATKATFGKEDDEDDDEEDDEEDDEDDEVEDGEEKDC